MIDWTDDGIVLTVSPHGEHAVLASLFTRTGGRYNGIVPGGQSRKLRGFLQTGALVRAHWRARTENQIGTLRLEPLAGFPSPLLTDRTRLSAATSILALVQAFLAERDPHPVLFEATISTLEPILRGALKTLEWAGGVAHWECRLLGEIGFGLDTSICALSGTTKDLAWISPNTGRAASRSAGAPWAAKLLPLPPFLLEQTAPAAVADLFDAFHLSGHFLARLEPMGGRRKDATLPEARARFLARLQRAFTQA